MRSLTFHEPVHSSREHRGLEPGLMVCESCLGRDRAVGPATHLPKAWDGKRCRLRFAKNQCASRHLLVRHEALGEGEETAPGVPGMKEGLPICSFGVPM